MVDQARQPVRRSRLLGDELGDQSVHQLGQAVRRPFDLGFGRRAANSNRKQRGVEGDVTGRPHDTSDQETAGTEPARQLAGITFREIVGVGPRGPTPGRHHRAGVCRPSAALTGEPRRDEVDHPLSEIA